MTDGDCGDSPAHTERWDSSWLEAACRLQCLDCPTYWETAGEREGSTPADEAAHDRHLLRKLYTKYTFSSLKSNLPTKQFLFYSHKFCFLIAGPSFSFLP